MNAHAFAQRGDGLASDAAARARAHATGASGLVGAEARETLLVNGGTALDRLGARAWAEVASSAEAAALVGEGGWPSDAPAGANAIALAAGRPLAADVEAALAGEERVTKEMADLEALALARMAFVHTGDDTRIELGADFTYAAGFGSTVAPFRVALLDAQLSDALGSLEVRVEQGGHVLFRRNFEKARKLIAYFDDRMLKLKAPKRATPVGELRFVVEAELAEAGDAVTLDFLIAALRGDDAPAPLRVSSLAPAVPEPRALVLLAAFCAVAALRRR